MRDRNKESLKRITLQIKKHKKAKRISHIINGDAVDQVYR